MSAAKDIKPIIVWCHPRSCSTAFERAFLQREDTQTFHEPLGDPFYFGQKRACHRYSDEECRKSEGYDKTLEGVALSLLESANESRETPCRFVFIKVGGALTTRTWPSTSSRRRRCMRCTPTHACFLRTGKRQT